MNISVRTLTISLLVVAGLSAALTKFYFPNVEEKTQTIEKEVVKKDIVTVVREVTRPDGTKEVVTETVDKSTSKSTNKEVAVKYDVTSEYIFGVGVVTQTKELKPEYSISAGKRIFGPIFGQVEYQTNGYIGVKALIEF